MTRPSAKRLRSAVVARFPLSRLYPRCGNRRLAVMLEPPPARALPPDVTLVKRDARSIFQSAAISPERRGTCVSGQPNNKPPRRYWKATESFFNLKFSHVAELFFAAALFAIGVLQVTVYYRQAGIMEQQTVISQAEHRPWISANPITLIGDLTHDDAGLRMTMTFDLKNSGHSPSRHAFVSFTPSLEARRPDEHQHPI
jgi:hypothetical protein